MGHLSAPRAALETERKAMNAAIGEARPVAASAPVRAHARSQRRDRARRWPTALLLLLVGYPLLWLLLAALGLPDELRARAFLTRVYTRAQNLQPLINTSRWRSAPAS